MDHPLERTNLLQTPTRTHQRHPQDESTAITYQRDDKFGRLTKERALKLHKLGVKLQNREEAWNERYNELVLYYRRHGDCLVPRQYSEAPHLRKFVNTQRQMIKVGTLRPDRVKLLDEIGFCWNAHQRLFDNRDNGDGKCKRMPREQIVMKCVQSKMHIAIERSIIGWVSCSDYAEGCLPVKDLE